MSTQHTGTVVSAAEADAWHEQIKKIMSEHRINFADAVNFYIVECQRPGEVDMSGWDAA